jgi:hypothetical protein
VNIRGNVRAAAFLFKAQRGSLQDSLEGLTSEGEAKLKSTLGRIECTFLEETESQLGRYVKGLGGCLMHLSRESFL